MKENRKDAFIRVKPETRHKLKIVAAQRNVSMQQLIDALIDQEIGRDKKADNKHGTESL